MKLPSTLQAWRRRPYADRPLQITLLGPIAAGKTTILRQLKHLTTYCQQRWGFRIDWDPHTIFEIPPEELVPKNEADLESPKATVRGPGGRRFRLTVWDARGGLMTDTPPPQDDQEPAKWPELYQRTTSSDLLILTLDARVLTDVRLEVFLNRMLNHANLLFLRNPEAMIFVAFTQADEYGILSASQPRFWDGARAQQALRDFQAASRAHPDAFPEDQWKAVLEAGPAPDDLMQPIRAYLLERTRPLWEKLLTDSRPGRVNGYWVAAQPRDTSFPKEDRFGLSAMFADFFETVRRTRCGPRLTAGPIAAAAAVTILVFGVGLWVRARADHVQQFVARNELTLGSDPGERLRPVAAEAPELARRLVDPNEKDWPSALAAQAIPPASSGSDSIGRFLATFGTLLADEDEEQADDPAAPILRWATDLEGILAARHEPGAAAAKPWPAHSSPALGGKDRAMVDVLNYAAELVASTGAVALTGMALKNRVKEVARRIDDLDDNPAANPLRHLVTRALLRRHGPTFRRLLRDLDDRTDDRRLLGLFPFALPYYSRTIAGSDSDLYALDPGRVTGVGLPETGIDLVIRGQDEQGYKDYKVDLLSLKVYRLESNGPQPSGPPLPTRLHTHGPPVQTAIAVSDYWFFFNSPGSLSREIQFQVEGPAEPRTGIQPGGQKKPWFPAIIHGFRVAPPSSPLKHSVNVYMSDGQAGGNVRLYVGRADPKVEQQLLSAIGVLQRIVPDPLADRDILGLARTTDASTLPLPAHVSPPPVGFARPLDDVPRLRITPKALSNRRAAGP